MRVKMCSIHVTDPAAAFRFYTEVVGFEELLAIEEMHLYVVRSPQDRNGVGLLLEPSDNPIAEAYRAGIHAEGLPALVLGSPDVEADYQRLRAAGVHFTQPPRDDTSGVTAVFDDTCGNYIQLHQD